MELRRGDLGELSLLGRLFYSSDLCRLGAGSLNSSREAGFAWRTLPAHW